MKRKYSFAEKRKIIIQYIKKNPKTTHIKIRKNTGLHPERVFKEGLTEAFKAAGINPPRTFKRKIKKERQEIIINYIRKHPYTGGHTIAKHTKINIASSFKNIEEAFKAAGIKYPRKIDKRKRKKKIKEIIKAVKENPLINVTVLIKKTKTQPYHFFKNMDEIYERAGLKPIKGWNKRRLKKKKEVLKYIKQNPLATQREINKACKTKVQDIFNKGIFEAYEEAKVKFPYERLKLYGVGIKKVRNRAKDFEDKIAIKLSGYGKVNRLVKTKRGVADIIFERNGKKAVIEIKDYKNKDISISQIKQLNKYLEDIKCKLGLLICHHKPKKGKFLMGKNKIFILTKEELKKIPLFMRDSG